jgi:hypothetical protein
VAFRSADSVIARYDLACTVTGGSVRCGDSGVILRQVGSAPATFKVRFTVANPVGATVVLDGVTDRDIAHAGLRLGDPHEVDQQDWSINGVRGSA